MTLSETEGTEPWERLRARLRQGGRLAGDRFNHSGLLGMSEQGSLVRATLSQPQWPPCHRRLTSTPSCPDPERLFCLGSQPDAQVAAGILCSRATGPRLETPPRPLLPGAPSQPAI